MAPVLGYWKIRGLAQPIRLLLAQTGTKFEDKMYESGGAPDYDKSCWFDVKGKLGLDFPNLPYYVDGDLKITQSGAIMRHIARKNGLCGKSEEEMIRVDVMENQIGDFRNNWVNLCYSPTFEKEKGDYIKNLPPKLKELSDYLGKRKWFAGDNLSFVDFIVYEMLDQHKVFLPDCLDATANLKDFATRFENLENIKKYMQSKDFMKAPFNNKIAKFGNK